MTKANKPIIIIFIAVLLLVIFGCVLMIKRVPVPKKPVDRELVPERAVAPKPIAPEEHYITDPDVKPLKSIILSTDKAIYEAEENIIALVLIKNDFERKKMWNVIAGISIEAPQKGSNISSLSFREQEITLSPLETKRLDIEFDAQKTSFPANEYYLTLNVFEDDQLIGLKTAKFVVR